MNRILKNLKTRAILIAACLFAVNNLTAQVTIGAGTPPKDFSILEMVSNKTGGMRLPHLTTKERDAVMKIQDFEDEKHRGDKNAKPTAKNPGLALGLTIYNTDTNSTEYWNGYKWVCLSLGTADIVLTSQAGDKYSDPLSVPAETADGNFSGNTYTPEDKPACIVSAGKAYEVYLTAGSAYAVLTADPLTSAFTVEFQPNNSSLQRNAVVRIVNNCTGEFKDFIVPQEGAVCPGADNPELNSTSLSLCAGGSVFAHVKNAQDDVDYIWTYGGVIVNTGNWYEIKRAGTYKVYAGLLGCGSAATLTVADNNSSTAPANVTISATNGGMICDGGNVILTANTTGTVLWYHNGVPLTATNKNDNPLTLTGAGSAGEWFAVVLDGGCSSASSNVLILLDNTGNGVAALPAPDAEVNGQSLTGGSLIVCKDGTLKLEVKNAAAYPAGTEYEWFNNGFSIGKGTAPVMYLVASNASNMVLSVTVSDQSGSCPNTAVSQNVNVNFTSPATTSINNGALSAPICGGTPASLTADFSGAQSYEWMQNEFTVPNQNGQTLLVSQPGSYSVRYQDANGCWSRVSGKIDVVQSAPISMEWKAAPAAETVRKETHTYSVSASPHPAGGFEWFYSYPDSATPDQMYKDGDTDATGAVVSIKPIGDGSSAVVVYGDPAATSTNVTIRVKTVGHPCGDVALSGTTKVGDGCTKATSVTITPSTTVTIKEGETYKFTAGTNASNNKNDLQYQWKVNGTDQGAASPTNTFEYTPTATGSYKISVEVTNECTTTPLKSQEVTLNVTPNPASFTPNTSGNYKLTGKDCYDVAQDNFNTTCGTQANRPGDFLDGSRNWVENRTFTYTFTATGAYTELQFITDDPNILLKTTNKPTGTTFTLTFDKSVLEKAKGKDRANALKVTVYALFKDAGSKNSRLEVNIKVQDCMCGCGAYIAKGTWKEFMCHNLGADVTSDPLKPSKGLYGDFYQWGRKTPAAFGPNAASPDAKNGTWNSSTSGFPSVWSSTNTPCPTGYRVPNINELAGLFTNNTVTYEGTGWNFDASKNPTDFSKGVKIGDYLFLPASGQRDNSSGNLTYRGVYGYYWSATYSTATGRLNLQFRLGSTVKTDQSLYVTYGMAVRCIKE
ncbi:MAG: fibrobacter succinogenes major paralogous domain-containing protein [Prevotella sp.]|nr:fibrobacter succinogenes major paralogous domain-containing protein [Prevotella sp.]